MMEHKLIEYIKHHRLLERDTKVLIGVSGGPDSMALMSFLHSIREEWGLSLIALSVDHGLRGEAARSDLAYVRHICGKWDIMFEGVSIDVASYKTAHQIGTQVAARTLRYRFFKEQMKKHQADCLALGHHADDQLETMLMNFACSSNPRALSGIPVKRLFATGKIIRPLLRVGREDIETYCKSKGITPRMDASNEDTAYTRNAVRKNVAPLIKELNPNVHKSLQHLSEVLQADEAYLMQKAREMMGCVVTVTPEKHEASFEMDSFLSYPSALQRRAFHLILNHLYSELPKNLSYMHEENFLGLLKHHGGNKEMHLPGQLKIIKTYQTVTFYMDYNNQYTDDSYEIKLEVPGETTLPDGSRIMASKVNNPVIKGEYTYVCNEEQVTLPLYVRTRKNGDRMGWKGLKGRKKLKDIFIDNKIPPQSRKVWPIVTDDNGQIIWIIGIKKKQQASQTTEQPYIQLTYEKVKGE